MHHSIHTAYNLYNSYRLNSHLLTYIFEDDATGRRIAQALMRAAQRGVATHLLIDGFGSKDVLDGFLQEMRDAGVQVLKYRPDISPWTLRRERLRRLHCKVAVIDPRKSNWPPMNADERRKNNEM